MSSRSGLTLVEVLASLVLLTLVAAATVPVLRAAGRAAHERADPGAVARAAEVADALVDDPAAFGLGAALPRSGDVVASEKAGGRGARFEVLDAEGGDAEHAWLAVEVDGVTVFRWLEEAPR